MYKTKTAAIRRYEVQLHGWDSQAESWHGPIPLSVGRRGARLILERVGADRSAFQGKLKCSVPGLPCIEFFTSVYDLRDTGLAIVHLDGARGGPVGILAVVPRTRRRPLRNDFAFELMTLISFLGAPINTGCELAIHDYMDEVLRTEPSVAQVFAVETAELSSDTAIVLSAHFEHLAAAILDWMNAREAQNEAMIEEDEDCRDCAIIPGVSAATALQARSAVV
jgi:hypothetical protein